MNRDEEKAWWNGEGETETKRDRENGINEGGHVFQGEENKRYPVYRAFVIFLASHYSHAGPVSYRMC